MVLLTLAAVVYAVGAAVFARRLARLPSNSAQELARSLRGTLRTLVVMTLVLGTAGIAGWNGWLCWQGIDAWQHLRERLAGVAAPAHRRPGGVRPAPDAGDRHLLPGPGRDRDRTSADQPRHARQRASRRRRRATIVPLMNGVFTYACWYGVFVLILSALGFNPMPFLAGAGVLGVEVGIGAQSLISDVVSGFFILFETVYLVGDVIEVAGPEVAGAKGTVEAREFRVTRIRDADGRLHIWRNGDIKQVINYSTDYIKAVVPVEVGYDADLQAVLRTLMECGERLRATVRTCWRRWSRRHHRFRQHHPDGAHQASAPSPAATRWSPPSSAACSRMPSTVSPAPAAARARV